MGEKNGILQGEFIVTVPMPPGLGYIHTPDDMWIRESQRIDVSDIDSGRLRETFGRALPEIEIEFSGKADFTSEALLAMYDACAGDSSWWFAEMFTELFHAGRNDDSSVDLYIAKPVELMTRDERAWLRWFLTECFGMPEKAVSRIGI